MKPQKKSPKLTIALTCALVILLAATGAFFYKQHQKNEAIAKERAQYAQAEKDLDALSAQIIAKLGQPDDSKKVRECGHTSSKLGTGALFCNLQEYLIYPIENVDSAKSLVQEAQSVSPHFSKLEEGDSHPNIATGSFSLSELNCSSGFSIHDQSEHLESLGYTDVVLRSAAQGMLIELSCSATHPKATYFPVTDS